MPEAVPAVNEGALFGRQGFLGYPVIIVGKKNIRQERFCGIPISLLRFSINNKLNFSYGKSDRKLKVGRLPVFSYIPESESQRCFFFVDFINRLNVFLGQIQPFLLVVGDGPGDFSVYVFDQYSNSSLFVKTHFVGPFGSGIQALDRLFPNVWYLSDKAVIIIQSEALVMDFLFCDFFPPGIMNIELGVKKAFLKANP